MESSPPRPAHPQPAILASLGNKSIEELQGLPHKTSVPQEQQERVRNDNAIFHNCWPLVRMSQVPATTCSRASTTACTDNEHFDSPRSSQSDRATGRGSDDSDDIGRPDSMKLSAEGFSTYEKKLPETPYHIMTLAEKKRLVCVVSLAGLFSPLSSNIYFPALGRIAKASSYYC